MSLSEEIKAEVKKTFQEKWEIVDGRVVPDTKDVALSNQGTRLDAVSFYADMSGSTKLVLNYKPEFAAEIYKTFLKTCCRVIRSEGGDITAFDGDRVMGVFIGDSKNSSAAKAALKINFVIPYVINPLIAELYPSTQFKIEFGIGIDSSPLLVARTGIRGANDLVWVGNSANLAAKLCGLRSSSKPIWITERVYEKLNKESKYGSDTIMWDPHSWTDYGIKAYSSNWHWKI